VSENMIVSVTGIWRKGQNDSVIFNSYEILLGSSQGG
jgi:hypothetical protein